MIRRLGTFWSAGAVLASALVAIAPVQSASALAVTQFQDWATVGAGDNHTCGVRRNGKLYCWGYDAFGQVGDGDASDATTPRRIGSFEDWVTVTAGEYHSCGVRKNGKLYCWGSDSQGQAGNGDATGDVTAPGRVGSFEDWVGVSAGVGHSCGVRRNGKLYCWGSDEFGQTGEGDDSDVPIDAPQRIGTFEDWVGVSAGGFHTCGVRRNGKLYCWGLDAQGEVGDGGGDPVEAPRRIGTFEDWTRVDAGRHHNCGVRHGGKLYCWGSDNLGQVGEGAGDDDVTSPRRIGTFEDWSRVAAGGTQTCGVRKNGKLYCWGDDSEGQVGDGDGVSFEPVEAPRRIGSLEDWLQPTTGQVHSCGVRSNGKLYCWGSDSNGQVGNGGSSSPEPAPVRV